MASENPACPICGEKTQLAAALKALEAWKTFHRALRNHDEEVKNLFRLAAKAMMATRQATKRIRPKDWPCGM